MQMDLKLAHEEFERGITHTGFHYTMSLIKRKYKLGIIYCLMMNGPTRYNELKRRLEAATFRSLTNSLKELEADGLISRKEYSQFPPKVEYDLTEKGKSMTPFLELLCDWGCEHMPKEK